MTTAILLGTPLVIKLVIGAIYAVSTFIHRVRKNH